MPRVTVGVPSPAYRNPAMPIGKGTILRGIRSELVQNHRHGLCRFRSEHNVGPIDERVALLHPGSKLATHELGETDAVPTVAAQESMRVGQRMKATIE
jgi:hypothetical protein